MEIPLTYGDIWTINIHFYLCIFTFINFPQISASHIGKAVANEDIVIKKQLYNATAPVITDTDISKYCLLRCQITIHVS